MKSASKQFSPDERARIETAVKDAEALTGAEIVPVVATASGRYDRPEDMAGLTLAIVAALVATVVIPHPDTGEWGGVLTNWKPAAQLAALAIGFFAGVVAASRIAGLRRLFTPNVQMRAEVDARARAVFYDSRIHHTARANGLMIYISLYERRAVVLADQGALAALGQAALDELCARLTRDLRAGNHADALAAAIRSAGEQLAQAMPPASNDANELGDALILID